MIPRVLSPVAKSDLFRPVMDALLAYRLGSGNSEHYHALAGAALIANFVANHGMRHRHLIVEMQPGFNALNAIYDRGQCEALPEEIDAIEDAMKIYRALIEASPPKIIRKAAINAAR